MHYLFNYVDYFVIYFPTPGLIYPLLTTMLSGSSISSLDSLDSSLKSSLDSSLDSSDDDSNPFWRSPSSDSGAWSWSCPGLASFNWTRTFTKNIHILNLF